MIPTNPRRFPPCLPQSSPPAEFFSSEASASGSLQSGISDEVSAALKAAETYRGWAKEFPLALAQRNTVTLASAFTSLQDSRGADCIRAALDATADQAELVAQQQKLIDVLLAEWDASLAYAHEETLHGKAKTWRFRLDTSAAVALALAAYRAEVQA